MPEMGLCEFRSKVDADRFIDWAKSIQSLGYSDGDLTVEPFNKVGSDLIQRVGIHALTMVYWMYKLRMNGKESHRS